MENLKSESSPSFVYSRNSRNSSLWKNNNNFFFMAELYKLDNGVLLIPLLRWWCSKNAVDDKRNIKCSLCKLRLITTTAVSPLETDTFTTATLTHFLLGDLPMLQCQKLFRPNYVIIMIGSTVQVLHWYKTHVDFNFWYVKRVPFRQNGSYATAAVTF